jgi:hypothetical protein
MVPFLARLPTPFEAHEQADGQRDGQAAKQFFLIHQFTSPGVEAERAAAGL